MRLLLDEMYPASLARDLRERRLDVTAVDEQPQLRGLDDEALLRVAAREGRALVSENVADMMRLYGSWAGTGREHHGVVIALSSRFSRKPAGLNDLAEALATLCDANPADDALRNHVRFLPRPE